MHNKKPTFFPENFFDQLRIINGIKFTHREIDVIAFLICGRAAKKIASFFSIAPKTVENHTHNIMIKLGCNSREGIIDFIEKSDRMLMLRTYYATLLVQASFEKSLCDIAELMQEEEHSCILTYWQEQDSSFLINQLENALKSAKINVLLSLRSSSQSLESLCNGSKVIYVIPNNCEGHTFDREEVTLLSKHIRSVLFFFPGKQDPIEIFKDFERGNAQDYVVNNSYYFLTFEILRKLSSNPNVEKIITDFEKQYEVIKRTVEQTNAPRMLTRVEGSKEGVKILPLVLLFLILGVFAVFYFEFKRESEIQIFAQNFFPQKIQKREELFIVRSDLVIPTSTTLLDRPKLIALINERFKGWQGIQAIALVGIGGAGKTTLARQYARQQKADRLAGTDGDQRILMGIMKLKDAAKREEKIIQFVKERLRTYQDWLLIFDNVEKFTDIQNHFPKDPGNWGQGRVLLTTQEIILKITNM